jgi:hypothetical protein
MENLQHPASARGWPWSRRLALAAGCALTLLASGCGKDDPEEQFRLWCNNEQGWAELGNYVADKNNDMKLRVRALELLAIDGHPSEVMKATEKAPDRAEVLAALQPAMFKLLQDGNPKRQGYGKRVLFEMIKEGGVKPDKAAEIKANIAKWAFGDLTHDTSLEALKEKMKDRLVPTEIEALGNEATAGMEVLLGKGISKSELVATLRNLKTAEAAKALVGGLRRYHAGKNVKVTEDDLGAIQATQSIEGFVYLLELYTTKLVQADPSKPVHKDDKAAAEVAIRVAIDFTDPEDPKAAEANKAKLKAGWAEAAPAVEKLLASPNCDDRWWAMQLFTTYGGAEGFKAALAKLPDDELYGRGPPHGDNDAKKMIMDLCLTEVKALGADTVRPLLQTTLKSSPRFIERIVAARCLMALGDPASVGALATLDKKDALASKDVQPIIVSKSPLSLKDMVSVAGEVAEYCASVDRLAAEGKIEADVAKWRKYYASYNFERRGKELAAEAELSAKEKVERDRAKKAGK